MALKKLTHLSVLVLLLFTAVMSACRKDDDSVSNFDDEQADTIAAASAQGSFLASSGKLKIDFNDTTYVFDAAKDSVAFICVDTAGQQYFGITAIDSAHSVSFGISGLGIAKDNQNTKVEGSQFLFNQADSNRQSVFTLSRVAHKMDMGKLSLKKYRDKDSTAMAKGSFTAFLAGDTAAKAPLYKVTGSFNLDLK